MEYFLAYDAEKALFLVQEKDEYGEVSTHSAFHKREVAFNTVRELNDRADAS
jgi:hypothetical protein